MKNKTALIIGGSGGIGKEISRTFASQGMNLIIQGRDKDKLEEFRRDLERNNKNTTVNTVCIDFAYANRENIVKSLNTYIKAADVLIVAFGPFLQKEVHLTTEEEWEQTVYWNYTFPGQLISIALNGMIKKRFGRILVFGGTRTDFINGFKTNGVYGGAKTALCSLVKSVARNYGRFGITCNAILPGFVDTEYLQPESRKILREKMPEKELISPKAIADSALFLVGKKELNGVLLNADAGWAP